MNLELSSIELKHIVKRLNETLSGYYINNIYLINKETILFKLHHSGKPEKRLALSAGKGLWITTYLLEPKKPLGITPALRRNLVRKKILKIEQPKGERIAILNASSPEGLRKLVGEFFANGNIILTDEEDWIISALKTLKVRHREILTGRKYTFPPPKGLDVNFLLLEDLVPSLNSKLEISRWLGRNLSLSKKYVEEILARAEIDPKAIGTNLTNEDIQKIHTKINEIINLIEAEEEPTIVLENGRPIDASPFKFLSYKEKDLKTCTSYFEAIDEVFTGEITAIKHEIEFRPLHRKIKEMNFALEEQRRQKERISVEAKSLRSTAQKLSNKVLSSGFQNIEVISDRIHELGIDKFTPRGDKLFISIKGLILKADRKCPIMKFVSQLYDEAKILERKSIAIELAEKSLIAERDALLKKIEAQKIAKKNDEKKIREKSWFERYRWFITSDGLLAIGGRDATSNTAIIKKHMNNCDLVFHADILGSPFFILKGTKEMEQSINETAHAVASYSRAWKEGFAAIDVYYVEPEQIKMQAPSGMYLPKGSFLIEGKRNYIKGLEIKIAIGLHKMEEGIAIMGGPISAVRKNSLSYVILEPDKVNISKTAKMVKEALVRIDSGNLRLLRSLSLDDIIRVLPGGGMIVFKDYGEQNINV